MSHAAVEHARSAVEAQKRRCREAYDAANACHLGLIAFACWGYRHEVRKLEQLKTDLANLERSP